MSHMGTGGALCSPVGESKLSLVLFIQGLGVNLARVCSVGYSQTSTGGNYPLYYNTE